MRWHPIVSFSVPHSTTKDDVYNGEFLELTVEGQPRDTHSSLNHHTRLDDPQGFYRSRQSLVRDSSSILKSSTSVLTEYRRAISRDETQHKNPEDFNPERFLKDGHIDPNIPDPRIVSFGYGRR